MRAQFRTDQKDGFWTVYVFYVTDSEQGSLFSDWDGFEEPFDEVTYQKMAEWCRTTFKTYIWPRRARRMSYGDFWFRDKKDLDWFILYWSGVDISVD